MQFRAFAAEQDSFVLLIQEQAAQRDADLTAAHQTITNLRSQLASMNEYVTALTKSNQKVMELEQEVESVTLINKQMELQMKDVQAQLESQNSAPPPYATDPQIQLLELKIEKLSAENELLIKEKLQADASILQLTLECVSVKEDSQQSKAAITRQLKDAESRIAELNDTATATKEEDLKQKQEFFLTLQQLTTIINKNNEEIAQLKKNYDDMMAKNQSSMKQLAAVHAKDLQNSEQVCVVCCLRYGV